MHADLYYWKLAFSFFFLFRVFVGGEWSWKIFLEFILNLGYFIYEKKNF